MIKRTLFVVLVCVAIWIICIYFWQDRMIYFPGRYYSESPLFKKVESVKYLSNDTRQVSYLYPTDIKATPEVVWWMFGGNGSMALDWISMLERSKFPEGHAFVLVEYPGYGRCNGKPHPDTISDSIGDLHVLLSEKWSITDEALSQRSRAFGHSLGAAVALSTAAKYNMSEVVAISPFTSMKDMAVRRVGFLSFLLKHHYDNRASVEMLVSQEVPATLHLFHGTRDSLIPLAMGEELFSIAGDQYANFHPVKGKGHNDIVYHLEGKLFELMQRK